MDRKKKLKKARFYYKTSKYYSIGNQSKNWYKKHKNIDASIEPPITQTELNLIPTNRPF
tara:strand:- start:3326 stop:3502 length:177 start_codon:yes stop_codon:yes gene_type:complete